MTALIQTRDLSCERDDRLLVDRLNLRVSPGAICRIEGPNGSGKTTLLRVLSGLSSRFSGDILWRGEPLHQVRDDYLSELIYLGHASGIKGALSPRENLRWLAALHPGTVAETAIEESLERVGLGGFEDSHCHTLSAGQQRRVALARLFLIPAALWVLDEPFTAIDRHGVSELEQWVAAFAQRGGSVILTTHHALSIEHPVHSLTLGDRQ